MLSRRTSALYAHRWSQSTATYFVTYCTRFRVAGLTDASLAGVVHGIVAALDAKGDTVTHAFTLMPDHLHWLFTLGNRLSLGRVIARVKAQSRDAMAAGGIDWQRDFFEHRLRTEEIIESYGLYVFLNPYRAGLVPLRQKWPHWWRPRAKEFWFISQLNPDGTPPAGWIGEPVPIGLAIGE